MTVRAMKGGAIDFLTKPVKAAALLASIERAVEQEIGCADVMQLIAATRGAINGLMGEVMEDHIRMHVIDPGRKPDSDRAQAAEELIDVVRSYLK